MIIKAFNLRQMLGAKISSEIKILKKETFSPSYRKTDTMQNMSNDVIEETLNSSYRIIDGQLNVILLCNLPWLRLINVIKKLGFL